MQTLTHRYSTNATVIATNCAEPRAAISLGCGASLDR